MSRVLPRRAGGLVLLALVSCAGPGEEARVRAAVDDVVRAAGKRDAAAVLARAAPDYADFEGRDKAAAERLVRSYFERFRGIVVHGLGSEVALGPGAGEAAVRLDVVLTTAAAEVFKRLAATSISLYRFRLNLKREQNRWLIVYAEWETIGPADLLAGSSKPLDRLYPKERRGARKGDLP